MLESRGAVGRETVSHLLPLLIIQVPLHLFDPLTSYSTLHFTTAQERPETRAADYCTWDVTPAILRCVKKAVDALNSTAVLGLNFRDGTNPMAAAIGEAHAIGDGIAPTGKWGRLDAFEIGNEPDRYTQPDVRTRNDSPDQVTCLRFYFIKVSCHTSAILPYLRRHPFTSQSREAHFYMTFSSMTKLSTNIPDDPCKRRIRNPLALSSRGRSRTATDPNSKHLLMD